MKWAPTAESLRMRVRPVKGEDLILDLKARIDFNFSLSLFFLLEAQWVQWGKSLLNQTGARLSASIELELLRRAVRSTPSSSRGQVGATPPLPPSDSVSATQPPKHGPQRTPRSLGREGD